LPLGNFRPILDRIASLIQALKRSPKYLQVGQGDRNSIKFMSPLLCREILPLPIVQGMKTSIIHG